MRIPRFPSPGALALLAILGAAILPIGCSNDSKPGDAQPIDIEEQTLLQDRIQEGITPAPGGGPG